MVTQQARRALQHSWLSAGCSSFSVQSHGCCALELSKGTPGLDLENSDAVGHRTQQDLKGFCYGKWYGPVAFTS